ncbi:hypothetical protein KI387_025323 [Taxus chinensis]|uniref:Uncharacterized protein n=1 Tax=Taxus chinensis TaxID=29808 RepID=A0AA38G5D5_TAXCH|nr:hypothetical protein KI387_025323 [Taxus chinensis]
MGIKESFSVLTPTSPPPPPVANGEINSIKVFQQGKQLLQEILLTSFTGLSGPIELHNGEMNASNSSLVYEIVNVVGKSYQVVGYLPYKSDKQFETLPLMGNEGVAPVFWPGSSTKIPLGWEIPSNGKRLRTRVPRNAGWKEFVNVTFYPDKNETIVTGFCIDVFKAVVRLLNYELPYDLFLYPPHANSADWSYDDLIRQVYLKVQRMEEWMPFSMRYHMFVSSSLADATIQWWGVGTNVVALDLREEFPGTIPITGTISSSVLMVYFYQALRKFVKDSDGTGNQWECLKSFARYLYQEPDEVSVSSQVDAAESWEDVEAEELVVDAGENIPSSSQVDAADSLPENEERSWVDVDEGEDMMSPTSTGCMPTTTNEPPSNQIQE